MDPIMVCHADNLDSDLVTSRYNGCIVVRLCTEHCLLVVPAQIGEGVDLQRATEETRPAWKFDCGIQAFGRSFHHAACFDRHRSTSVNAVRPKYLSGLSYEVIRLQKGAAIIL